MNYQNLAVMIGTPGVDLVGQKLGWICSWIQVATMSKPMDSGLGTWYDVQCSAAHHLTLVKGDSKIYKHI